MWTREEKFNWEAIFKWRKLSTRSEVSTTVKFAVKPKVKGIFIISYL